MPSICSRRSEFQKRLYKVLPNHKGEPKQQNFLPSVLFQKCLNLRNIQLHRLVQRIGHIPPQHGKAQNPRPAGREHIPVLQHGTGINDQHRQALLSQKVRRNPIQRFGLPGRGLSVQIDFRNPLSRCAGRGHGLGHTVGTYASQIVLLEHPNRQRRRLLPQRLTDSGVRCASLPVILG